MQTRATAGFRVAAARGGFPMAVAVFAAAALASASAQAQPVKESARPCHNETAPDQQQAAQKLLIQAYELHKQLRFEQTGELYRQALRYSQDPRIHLQAGIAFLSALRLLDAHEHLSEALRCGRGIIPEEEYHDAENMLDRVRKRLGEVEVHCSDSEAEVQFNGEPWFSCSDSNATRVVVAGQYLIRVERPAFVPVMAPVTIASGEHVIVEPTLMRETDATIVTRPWKRWQPWAVAGAGAALALAGAGLEWRAHSLFESYQRDLSTLCTPSCSIRDQAALQSRFDAATWHNRVAVGSLIAGGLALATGFTLAYLNQPSTRQHPDAGSANIRVTPMVTGHGAGVSLDRWF